MSPRQCARCLAGDGESDSHTNRSDRDKKIPRKEKKNIQKKRETENSQRVLVSNFLPLKGIFTTILKKPERNYYAVHNLLKTNMASCHNNH